MIQITQESKEEVLSAIKQGRIDAADISQPNFIDGIILKMKEKGVVDELRHIIEDKRKENAFIPLEIIWVLSIASKMKIHTSLTDIPYAIMDAETLSAFGYALWDTERDLSKGLMAESAIGHLLGKYEQSEMITGYNRCVQVHILPKMGIAPNLHILDCTKVEVELSNENYEEASVVKEDGEARRGYKLATLRGITGDSGMIEDIRFGTMKTHDLELSREMILSSPMLRPGDCLINDRGFLSRDVLNELKIRRGVETYIPLRKNMDAYVEAVSIATTENNWKPHPNKKRKTQKIAFVSGIGQMWRSEQPENDVSLNACVVWKRKADEYYVFVTTDTTKTAKQIIQTYELRPEIEEDYRQLKDFWCLEDFKSTKINVIAFHIVCTLLGYLMFQLYVGTEDGNCWAGKSLPTIMKKYVPPDKPRSVIVYSGLYFAIFPLVEFFRLYASVDAGTRSNLDEVLSLL
jgi:hypothetical protein